jgi:hypothetical protein
MLATRSSSTTPIPGLPPPILPPPTPILPYGALPDPEAGGDCPCGEEQSGDTNIIAPTWNCIYPCPDTGGGGFGGGPPGGPMPVGPDTGGGAVAPPGSWGGGGISGPSTREQNLLKSIQQTINGFSAQNKLNQINKDLSGALGLPPPPTGPIGIDLFNALLTLLGAVLSIWVLRYDAFLVNLDRIGTGLGEDPATILADKDNDIKAFYLNPLTWDLNDVQAMINQYNAGTLLPPAGMTTSAFAAELNLLKAKIQLLIQYWDNQL